MEKKLDISRIKQLVSMRNSSVHYRVDSPGSLSPSAEDLIEIWRQLGNIFSFTHGEPTQADIKELLQEFETKWIV